jgi:hypothetical protein
MSAGKKTTRTFQCRDGLWSTFEEMAQELECSVDYLVNDAMKQYARQRGYKKDVTSQTNPGSPAPSSPTAGAAPPPAPAPPLPPSAKVGLPPLPAPSVSRPPGPPPMPSAMAAPPPPPVQRPPASVPLGSGPQGAPHLTVPLSPDRLPPLPQGAPGRVAPPPLPAPSAAPRKPVAAPIAQKLTIHYQGRPFQVAKDRFIIGRGKTSSDLTIRDPNVSRQHALVEFSGGNFYMVDMGSTNGIEFSGQRVQRKAIQNGDVFRICDHELFCSMG